MRGRAGLRVVVLCLLALMAAWFYASERGADDRMPLTPPATAGTL